MFQITCIENGWFDFVLSNKNEKFYLSCSNVGGYDSAKALLSAVIDITIKGKHIAKIVCNAESEAHILHLTADKNKIIIDVVALEDSPFHFVGEQFSSLDFVKTSAPLFTLHCNANEFKRKVCTEFGNVLEQNAESTYASNWFRFPHAEYNSLFEYFKYRF